MRLSEFIHKNRKKIIREWVTFARTLHPWSKGRSNKDLQDHADEMLTLVVSDMRERQTGHEQAEKSKGRGQGGALSRVGQKHAIERLEGGLRLDQLVSEYRALRASVLRLWEQSHADKENEMTRFNEAIDETLAESAVWYSEKATQTREQFLAILGHDLRNPLASIIMGAASLTRSATLDVKQLGVATRIHNSGERMNRMVSDLLDLTRTRLGSGIPVTPKPMDLAPLCEQVIAELRGVHIDCPLEFKAKGDLRGTWDSDRLAQVVSNLVGNALQYGGDDPVRLLAQGHAAEVVLRVHNGGKAIAASALPTLFQPMVRQAQEDGDKNVAGLGLGLFIAKEIVVAHGGTIDVTSTDKGGTTFTVHLPRRLPKQQVTAV